MPTPSPSAHVSSGGRLIAADGRALPLRSTSVNADARGGGARVELTQVFVNPHAEPLRVHYQVPLPAEGAVSGFAFEVAGVRTVGRVEARTQARERFEQAILEGRTAALFEQERSSVFTQELGNVPPGETITVSVLVDQPLRWVMEDERGWWEWRFPTVVGPRYLGALGRVDDATRISTSHTTSPLSVDVALELNIRDTRCDDVQSPSHALVRRRSDESGWVVGLEGDVSLDRDVVVRWAVGQPDVLATLDQGRPAQGHARAHEAFATLTLTPPAELDPGEILARDLIVLLDTSGSMNGEPLEQAKRIVLGLLDDLTEADRLELIEFSSRPRRWKRGAVAATERRVAAARRWVQSLSAGGGTEMTSGLMEALAGVRPEAQRQVVLVSDGYIGFEREIVSTLLERLPAASRLHTVGVGSAVNRSLTEAAARAGRGVEILVGLGEDVERATARLRAATARPVVVDLRLEGSVEPATERLPDLFAGRPARIPLRVPADGGPLTIRGRTTTGAWETRLELEPCEPGQGSMAVVTGFGRDRVEALEMRRVAGEDVDATIERLGLEFQIATRLTSWVAVSDAVAVDPSSPSRRETVPHALPAGTSIAGLGLRTPAPMAYASAMPPMAMAAGAPPSPAAPSRSLRRRMSEAFAGPPKAEAPEEAMSEIAASGSMGNRAASGPSEPFGTGRWWRAGGRWVIEIELQWPRFTWAPPTAVRVVLSDGRGLDLELEVTRSTRAGELRQGMVLRLVGVLPAELGSDAPHVLHLQPDLVVPLRHD